MALYIHAGFHKTGTSSIQHFCAVNEERLANFGIQYPVAGRKRLGAHHTLVEELLSEKPKSYWDTIVASVKQGTTVLISSEAFGRLTKRGIQELKQIVDGIPVKLIFYIRDYASHAQSTYVQRTRQGLNLLDFDEFFPSYLRPKRLAHSAKLMNWAEAFGRENVRLRSLDPRHLDHGNLIGDFVSALGLKTASFPLEEGQERQNVSPGWKAVEILRAVLVRVARESVKQGVRDRGIVTNISDLIVGAAKEAGLDREKGRYLTLDQWEVSQSAYRKTIEELNKWLVGPKIPIPERSQFSERCFLPSIDHVPSDQLSWMVERLCRASRSTGDPAAQLVDAVASEFSRIYKRRAIRVSKVKAEVLESHKFQRLQRAVGVVQQRAEREQRRAQREQQRAERERQGAERKHRQAERSAKEVKKERCST